MSPIEDFRVEEAARVSMCTAPFGVCAIVCHSCKERARKALEAADRAKPPGEEVVTEEMVQLGLGKYFGLSAFAGFQRSQMEAMASAYLAMRSAAPKPAFKKQSGSYNDDQRGAVEGAHAPEGSKAELEATTVAIGLVPGRSDGMLSLHVGSTHVLLDPTEAQAVARHLAHCADLGCNFNLTRHKAGTIPIKYQRRAYNSNPELPDQFYLSDNERSGKERRQMEIHGLSPDKCFSCDLNRRKSQRRKGSP